MRGDYPGQPELLERSKSGVVVIERQHKRMRKPFSLAGGLDAAVVVHQF